MSEHPLGEPLHYEGTAELTEEGQRILDEMMRDARKRRDALQKARDEFLREWCR